MQEVEALENLSNALSDLVKSQLMSAIKSGIIKHTFLAALFASLSPVALLKLGKIIDNPWANAKALADKTGRVLGVLLEQRAFGNRPVTLTGYSLGALVVLSALEYLAGVSLRSSETGSSKEGGEGGEDGGGNLNEDTEGCSMHIVQDVFLMGTPVPSDGSNWPWARARRVVAGRLVNAYTDAESDYVLAFLSRVSLSSLSINASTTTGGSSFGVAGLQPVDVAGVENVKVDGVEGHVAWRGLVGRCLAPGEGGCAARGVSVQGAEEQEKVVGGGIKREIEEGQREAGGDVGVDVGVEEERDYVDTTRTAAPVVEE